jgi:hypothetical protein
MVYFALHANAWPAVAFHLVIVLHASEISNGIRSTSFGGFLADWISGSYVMEAIDVFGLWALVSFSGN